MEPERGEQKGEQGRDLDRKEIEDRVEERV